MHAPGAQASKSMHPTTKMCTQGAGVHLKLTSVGTYIGHIWDGAALLYTTSIVRRHVKSEFCVIRGGERGPS